MPIVRDRRGPIYMFQTHTVVDNEGDGKESEMWAPTDCNGFFPSHTEWYAMVWRVNRFYGYLSPANINDANENVQARIEQEITRQRQRPYEEDTTRQCPGYVYLLGGGDYYKIGLSNNVNRRIEEISPRLPFKTELICTIATDDMYGLEAGLHRQFAEKRANGEWFELDDEDVEYIRRLAE